MKKILLFFVGLTLVTSCINKSLDIKPMSDISSEIYWKSEKDVRATLNSAYAHLLNAYKLGFLHWNEARSDNFLGKPSGSAIPYQNIAFNKLDASLPSSNWNNWYSMISVANHTLHFVPGMDNVMSEARRNHLLSEAYFIRAFAYFQLYRIWGDVPLVTEPALKRTDVTKPPKTDKTQIITFVRDDLKKAIDLVDNGAQEHFIYSPGALYALSTDVAMWLKDYDMAIDCSQKLFDLNKYSVENVDFSLVCSNAQTNDNIWTLKWSFVSNSNNLIVGNYYNSTDLLIPTRVIYEKWQAWEDWSGTIDQRRVATLDISRLSAYGANHVNRTPTLSRIWKWSPGVRAIPENVSEAYIPLYRFADIILLRAEALNKKSRYSEAIDEMNRVRERAGLKEKTLSYYLNASSEIDSDLIEEEILQERQFELFAEGKRWFDLMRTQKAISVMNAHYDGYITDYGGIGFKRYTDEWQLYWPIHQDILNENEYLIQTGNY